MTRWPIIRHVRYFVLRWQFEMWWAQASTIFVAPNPSDIAYLEAVWKGEA